MNSKTSKNNQIKKRLKQFTKEIIIHPIIVYIFQSLFQIIIY